MGPIVTRLATDFDGRALVGQVNVLDQGDSDAQLRRERHAHLRLLQERPRSGPGGRTDDVRGPRRAPAGAARRAVKPPQVSRSASLLRGHAAVVAASALLAALVLAVPGPRASAAAAVPAPEAVLGFVPGTERRLADWSQVLAYVRALAAASDRVTVEELGRTTQGRPFVLATVSSAAQPRAARGDPDAERAARRPARAGRRRGRAPAARGPGGRGDGVLDPLDRGGRHARGAAAAAPARVGRGRGDARLARRGRAAGAAVPQPRRHRHRGRLVPAAARHAVRGHGAARALPPVRRPRQQPRLVHVHAAGDAADRRRPVPALAPADRARRAPDGRARGAAVRPPVRRPLGAERGRRAGRGGERDRRRTWPRA